MSTKFAVNPKYSANPLRLPCAADAIDSFLSRPSSQTVDSLGAHRGPFMVLGAGGKMGLHLSVMLRRALAAAGRNDRVLAVSRFQTLRDREDFARHDVETIACNLENQAELAALPDAPTVFFLAGVKFGTAGEPDLLRRVNADMPRQVAARFCGARIVAFSTGCVYPFVTPASGGATEETPPVSIGEYAASCMAREHAFHEVGLRSGANVVLVRLNYAVEFRYGLLVDVALKVLRDEVIDVTMGYANAIWQTDALNYAIQSLETAGNPAVPLNITGAEVLSIREIAHRFGSLLGRPIRIAGIEAETAWLNNSARAHRLFGPPETSLEQMLEWVAAWVGTSGEVWGKPTGFERRDGKF